MAPPKRFQLSDETAQIVRFLQTLDKGALVSYSELSRLVGIKLHSGHHKLTYSRYILKRDHNAVWVCIKPRVGLKRLNDLEIAERLPAWWLNGAHNKLARAGTEADIVDYRSLDIDQQARFGVDCIQRELAFDALSKATRKKMERVARGTSNDLPSFTAVEWAISLSPKVGKK
jgi:hypothetical protein